MNRDLHRHIRIYSGHFAAARVRVAIQTWIPPLSLFAAAVFLVSRRYFSWTEPAGSLAATGGVLAISLMIVAVASRRRSRGIAAAISWLDRKLDGGQVLQSAWEYRDRPNPFSGLLDRKAVLQLNRGIRTRQYPAAGQVRTALSVVAPVLLIFVVAGGFTVSGGRDREMMLRGRVLEEWAQSWAEYSDASGLPESRELAERMEELGRRMAGGALEGRRTERSLRELEESLLERRDDLIRQNLAETLVEDLNVDRETAREFMVRRGRLPAEVLADLGEALPGSEIFPQSTREILDRLLADPDLRDRLGNGTPELTRKLAEALGDGISRDDPRIRELEEALDQVGKAGGENDAGENPGAPRSRSSAELDERTPGPEIPAESSPAGNPGETARAGGGENRGDVPMGDGGGEPEPLVRTMPEETLSLSSDSDRNETWRTVIRAYSGDERPESAPSGIPSSVWEADVEAVISREDIPLRTREIVRDYFLALEEER